MTQAGSAFKRHVDALLHQLDDGLAAVSQLVDPETGAVRLAFQTSLGTWLIPDLVRSFWAEHPQVQFQLTQVRDELVDSVLDRGEADLVISTLRSADPAARRQRLLDEPLRLAVPSDHRMAQATEIRLADAADDRFVMVRPSSLLRQACDDLCRAAGFQPVVSFEGDDLTTVLGFVAVGLGVAIVPAASEGSPGPRRRPDSLSADHRCAGDPGDRSGLGGGRQTAPCGRALPRARHRSGPATPAAGRPSLAKGLTPDAAE